MSDALLILAGGASQRPFVESWRSLGLGLIVADRDPLAPCRELADAFLCVDVHDPAAVLAAVERQTEWAIRAVWTQSSGRATLTQARVSRALGLSAFSPELAELALDKGRFVDFLRARGLSTPERVHPAPSTEALPYPLVVRPAVTRVGKRGVAVADDACSLARAQRHAECASDDGRAVVTRFVDGEDLVWVGARVDGRLERIALVREYNAFAAGGLVHLGAELVCEPAREVVEPLEAELERLIASTGGGTGVVLACFRARGAQTFWTELHLDFGGDWIWEKLLSNAFGEDPISGVGRNLLGVRPAWKPPAPRASLLYALVEADRAVLSRLEELEGSADLEVLIERPGAGGAPCQRIGAIALTALDTLECQRLAAEIDARLGRRRGATPPLAPRMRAPRGERRCEGSPA